MRAFILLIILFYPKVMLYTVFEFKNYRLVEIKDPLIYQDGLDRRMLESGFPASLLIFASKHRSKDA